MPTLVKKLASEDLKRKGGAEVKNVDLTPYCDIIANVVEGKGEGAELALEPNEDQRTTKRRLTAAAKKSGYRVKWSTPAEAGNIRFRLIAA